MSGFPWQNKDLALSVNKRPIGAFIAFGLRSRLCDNLSPLGALAPCPPFPPDLFSMSSASPIPSLGLKAPAP